MGKLDDAIREHLDLKRRHGARDADHREIEDEAFGSTDRPDPFASSELFNEVSSTGATTAEPGEAPDGLDEGEGPGGLTAPDLGDEEPTRLVEPEALRPPEPSTETSEADDLGPISPPEGLELSPSEGPDQIPGQVELPGQDELPGQERLDDPLEGYQPSAEPEPESSAPSESLEDLIAEEEPFPEDSAAPPAAPREDTAEPIAPPEDTAEPVAPPEPEDTAEPALPEESDRPLTPEPESVVPDPPPPPPDAGSEPPGRARGRVDVPTQEHPPPGQTGGIPALPEEPERDRFEPAGEAPPIEGEPFAEAEPAAEEGGPALYDFETDEDPLASPPPPAAPAEDDDDAFDALGPAEEEAPYLEEEEPYSEEPVSGTTPVEEPGTEVRPALEDEEVYEGGTPDPEESWEEDEGEEGLWFEKGPPKDFDFDD